MCKLLTACCLASLYCCFSITTLCACASMRNMDVDAHARACARMRSFQQTDNRLTTHSNRFHNTFRETVVYSCACARMRAHAQIDNTFQHVDNTYQQTDDTFQQMTNTL